MTGAVIFVIVMLLLGLVCRQRVPIFRWMFIPASVIAGAIGLLVIQISLRLPGAVELAELADQLSSWPGWLIAVVFAGLLLERQEGQGGVSPRRTLSQAIMVWIIVLGQTATGLLVTWLFVQRFYDVPNSFGMLIETGFAGGHGTAGAMGEVFAHPTIDLAGGLDLGLMMATIGLVYGVVSGIGWINLAARWGWLQRPAATTLAPASTAGKEAPAPRPLGYEILDREAIDPLLLQAIWLGLAFAIGWLLHATVATTSAWLDSPAAVASQVAESPLSESQPAESQPAGVGLTAGEQQLGKRLSWSAVLGGFPLFIYTLAGGWMVRRALVALRLGHLLDTRVLKSLTAIAMDILVVAAMASLNLTTVATLFIPLTALLLAAFVWTGVCLLVLSKRILPPQHWFELGLINYGMSTGTTATGFVLLRVVDPHLETSAAEDYALAAPLSAPFIGGGIVTVGLPLLVLERVPILASITVAWLLVAGLVLLGMRLQSRG